MHHIRPLAALCAIHVVLSSALAAGAEAPKRTVANILPFTTTQPEGPAHPLDARIRQFMAASEKARIEPTGLGLKDYLRIIDGQIAFFRKCQNETGAIIDPVEKIEWQYSTPCYALSVALLAASGFNRDPDLLNSGMRAMSASVDEMVANRTAHNHGEFFIQPVMLALDLYKPLVPAERVLDWKDKLSRLDPYQLYPDNLPAKTKQHKAVYNHNVVALAGEYLRLRDGLHGDADFIETHLAYHTKLLSPLGMYRDPNVPMVYDEFSRQYLASILCEGYHGPQFEAYREKLWMGAWTSLFMQSPFGEVPTGGRSAQHIWNEAESAVTYEIYAAQYARAGRMAQAGAFKRAAHLSLACINSWLRPDGSGYIVKNRYPIEAHHGYERYSAQSQYNLLACWLMSVACLYADESITERACPADVGGFVVPMVEDFHKIFANAGGTYIEYETAGDLSYNPTGLIRCHIRGSNPQIGPSDGVVHLFDRKAKKDLGGENVAVGPAWQDAAGVWHRLADYRPSTPPVVEVVEENSDLVRFDVIYRGEFDGAIEVRESFTLVPGKITVRASVTGQQLKAIRVYYPALVFDGLEETKLDLKATTALLTLRGSSIQFAVVDPPGIELKRAGTRLEHRNGLAEPLYADLPGFTATYTICLPESKLR